MARTKTRRLSLTAALAEAERTGAFATDPAPEAPAPEAKAKTRKVWEPLPADRAAWVAAHARPAVAPCLCGCGQTTKGRFAPGHDATLHQALLATDSDEARSALAAFGW